MKFYALILGFVFFAISCKKDPKIVVKGELTVNINGVEWVGSINKPTATKFDINATRYKSIDKVFVNESGLLISNIPFELKTSTLKKIDFTQQDQKNLFCGFFTYQDDGDVACDTYEIIETDSVNNWIKVTKQTNNYAEVWGTFSATFFRKQGCSATKYADTLRFRDGVFHAYLK